ncbi:MAG: SAM-dependent chlorinase/fluorinase [Chloroflexi bacterium]|nr:SAM-dependent chlorinase/fluorinase [Chloroflexota bacterium]
MTRPIFLLTDFGTRDTYVGVVKAVMLGIAPDATLVDLTHEIPPRDVRAGAFALLTAIEYLPADAVVMAVVDPGVGSARRPIAVQVRDQTFVAPDNGLLSWILQDLAGPSSDRSRAERLRIVELDSPEFWRSPLSATFHARDLFGPVAAHLARGVPLDTVGSPAEPIVELLFPSPQLTRAPGGQIVKAEGTVVHVDHFGNLITTLGLADLPRRPSVVIGDEIVEGLSPHYQVAEAGQLVALIGSTGLLEIAVPNGSASKTLGLGIGAGVTATSNHDQAGRDAPRPPTA